MSERENMQSLVQNELDQGKSLDDAVVQLWFDGHKVLSYYEKQIDEEIACQLYYATNTRNLGQLIQDMKIRGFGGNTIVNYQFFRPQVFLSAFQFLNTRRTNFVVLEHMDKQTFERDGFSNISVDRLAFPILGDYEVSKDLVKRIWDKLNQKENNRSVFGISLIREYANKIRNMPIDESVACYGSPAFERLPPQKGPKMQQIYTYVTSYVHPDSIQFQGLENIARHFFILKTGENIHEQLNILLQF